MVFPWFSPAPGHGGRLQGHVRQVLQVRRAAEDLLGLHFIGAVADAKAAAPASGIRDFIGISEGVHRDFIGTWWFKNGFMVVFHGILWDLPSGND